MIKRTLSQSIQEYIAYLKVEKNLSSGSVRQYKFDLEKFQQYLSGNDKEDLSLEVINTPTIRDFLAWYQTERKIKSYTMARKISSLKSFFQFMVQQHYMENDPMMFIKSPKLPRKLPLYLTEHELTDFLSKPDRTTHMGRRDFAILALFSYTGMRLSELTGLDLDSYSFDSRTVRVMGKGSKERILPLIPLVIEALKDYLDIRPDVKEKALFLSNREIRFSNRGIEHMVDKYRLMSGIPKGKFSPHKLRHTFATLLHHKDVDILDIQTLLGHRSVATTQIYTHTSNKRLHDVVNKLNTFENE